MIFGPLEYVLTLLKGPPNSYFFNIIFSNIRFLSFIVTLSPLAKNAVPMVKSVNFDSLGPLLPFSKAHPPKVLKNGNFQKWYFFAVFLCHIEPTCQKLRFYNQKCEFGPLGPFCPFWKGPRTHQKRKFSKITISSVLLCHTESTYQKLCFYHQNCGF